MDIEALATEIVDAAYKVHKNLGPGLLESIYEECLAYELRNRGIKAEQQVSVPIVYEELQFEAGFRIDILVENEIVIELKACEKLLPVHEAQVLTYMKFKKATLGFLINFNVPLIKDGIHRKKL